MTFRSGAVIFLFFIIIQSINAWGYALNGHRVIAMIAYDHLTPTAKRRVDELTAVLFNPQDTPRYRFVSANLWPDWIKADGVTAFNRWHFVNYRDTVSGGHKAVRYNHRQSPPTALMLSAYGDHKAPVVQRLWPDTLPWAIQQSETALASPRVRPMLKALFLSFLTHLVGDAHQPLHCIDRYSRRFPRGDQGGNLFLIRSPVAGNLHAFWDQGGGLFVMGRVHRWRRLTQLAQEIQRDYPLRYFGKQCNELSPLVWARDSYRLAVTRVYTLPFDSAPARAYVTMTQQLVKQQVALAGYRMAAVLNGLFN